GPLPQPAVVITRNDLDTIQHLAKPEGLRRYDLAGLIAEGLPLGKELGFPAAACSELVLQAEGGAADRAGGHAQGCPEGAVLPKKVPAESDRRAGVRRDPQGTGKVLVPRVVGAIHGAALICRDRDEPVRVNASVAEAHADPVGA